MAKLRFGEITLKAVPAPSMEMPQAQHKVIDPSAMMEEMLSRIPMPKEIEHQDLTYLENAISSQASRLMEHNERLLILEKEKNNFAPQLLSNPEVRNITNIKDVSKEVMEHVEANKQENKVDYMCLSTHIVHIEASLSTQKIINGLLVGTILMMVLLHFRGIM